MLAPRKVDAPAGWGSGACPAPCETWAPVAEGRPAIALNRARIGHRYPTYRYEVSREKMKEYAAATRVEDPLYRADPLEVPSDAIVAPPTFAACFTLGGTGVLSDAELGAHADLVHSSQEFTYERPVRGGDVLACTPWVVDIVPRDRFDMLTLQVDCADARTGEAVLTARSVLLFFNSEEG